MAVRQFSPPLPSSTSQLDQSQAETSRSLARRLLTGGGSAGRPSKSYRRLAEMLLASFEARMRARNFSEHTIRGYLFSVRQYLAFLRSADPREDLQRRIHHYIERLMLRKLSPRTVAHHLTVLREFFKHLNREGVIHRNPILELPRRRGYSRPLPRVLSEDDTTRLIESMADLRDKAILEFFYGTGCRVGELVKIAVEDIDFAERIVLL